MSRDFLEALDSLLPAVRPRDRNVHNTRNCDWEDVSTWMFDCAAFENGVPLDHIGREPFLDPERVDDCGTTLVSLERTMDAAVRRAEELAAEQEGQEDRTDSRNLFCCQNCAFESGEARSECPFCGGCNSSRDATSDKNDDVCSATRWFEPYMRCVASGKWPRVIVTSNGAPFPQNLPAMIHSDPVIVRCDPVPFGPSPTAEECESFHPVACKLLTCMATADTTMYEDVAYSWNEDAADCIYESGPNLRHGRVLWDRSLVPTVLRDCGETDMATQLESDESRTLCLACLFYGKRLATDCARQDTLTLTPAPDSADWTGPNAESDNQQVSTGVLLKRQKTRNFSCADLPETEAEVACTVASLFLDDAATDRPSNVAPSLFSNELARYLGGELDFSDVLLSPAGAFALASWLDTNDQRLAFLTGLFLSDCDLRDEGVTVVCESLHRNRTITTMELVNNGITDDGLGAVANLFSSGFASVDFNLSDNLSITSRGVITLLQALDHNTTLTSLSIPIKKDFVKCCENIDYGWHGFTSSLCYIDGDDEYWLCCPLPSILADHLAANRQLACSTYKVTVHVCPSFPDGENDGAAALDVPTNSSTARLWHMLVNLASVRSLVRPGFQVYRYRRVAQTDDERWSSVPGLGDGDHIYASAPAFRADGLLPGDELVVLFGNRSALTFAWDRARTSSLVTHSNDSTLLRSVPPEVFRLLLGFCQS